MGHTSRRSRPRRRQSMVGVWTHGNAPPCLTPAALGDRRPIEAKGWTVGEEGRGTGEAGPGRPGSAAHAAAAPPLGHSACRCHLHEGNPRRVEQGYWCSPSGPATRPVLKREQVSVHTHWSSALKACPQGQDTTSSRQGAVPVLGLRTWVSHPASGGPALPLLQQSPRGFTGQGPGLHFCLCLTPCVQGTCPGSPTASHSGGRPMEGYCGHSPGRPTQPS